MANIKFVVSHYLLTMSYSHIEIPKPEGKGTHFLRIKHKNHRISPEFRRPTYQTAEARRRRDHRCRPAGVQPAGPDRGGAILQARTNRKHRGDPRRPNRARQAPAGPNAQIAAGMVPGRAIPWDCKSLVLPQQPRTPLSDPPDEGTMTLDGPGRSWEDGHMGNVD